MAVVEPVISINQGQLRGKIVNVGDGRTYYSFQGIPYAKPPLGEFRFKVSAQLCGVTGLGTFRSQDTDNYRQINMILV